MGPRDDIAMVPPQVGKCPNARSKLDDLLSRILDINAIMRKLSETIQESAPFIDAIAPADRGQEDCDPRYVGTKMPYICDRELNAIFAITREKKGPNIVFIADCCHSASVARDGLSRNRALRPLPSVDYDHLHEMLSRAQQNVDANASQLCIFSVIFYG